MTAALIVVCHVVELVGYVGIVGGLVWFVASSTSTPEDRQ